MRLPCLRDAKIPWLEKHEQIADPVAFILVVVLFFPGSAGRFNFSAISCLLLIKTNKRMIWCRVECIHLGTSP